MTCNLTGQQLRYYNLRRPPEILSLRWGLSAIEQVIHALPEKLTTEVRGTRLFRPVGIEAGLVAEPSQMGCYFQPSCLFASDVVRVGHRRVTFHHRGSLLVH